MLLKLNPYNFIRNYPIGKQCPPQPLNLRVRFDFEDE